MLALTASKADSATLGIAKTGEDDEETKFDSRTVSRARLDDAVRIGRRSDAQNYDPPGRVARIRYIQGSVSFAPAGESEWVAAVTNRPVTIGDQLWVDAKSRAELDAGAAVIRMNANTAVSFLNLDDRTLQVQLTQGAINLRIRRLQPGDIVEVDTPNQAFSVVEPGEYRVDAGADGNSSMVVVRQGHGQVTGGGQSYDLYSGQSGRFDGTGTDSLTGQLITVSSPDDFDRWGESRDSQYERVSIGALCFSGRCRVRRLG